MKLTLIIIRMVRYPYNPACLRAMYRMLILHTGHHRRWSTSSVKSWMRSKLPLPSSRGRFASLRNRFDTFGTSPDSGVSATIRTILTTSYFNLLLFFVPFGILAQVTHWTPISIFALNALAIIPLTGLLTYATENVAQTLGVGLGALLNITFGNLVELIILLFMLMEGHLRLVLASLLGSIFVNLLFILGLAVYVGGLKNHEQLYDQGLTQMLINFMNLGILSILIPTSLHACIRTQKTADRITLEFSRGTALTLLVVYGLYLHFMLKSRYSLYDEAESRSVSDDGEMQFERRNRRTSTANTPSVELQQINGQPKHNRNMSEHRSSFAAAARIPVPIPESKEEPEISRKASIILMIISSAVVAICAQFLVDSIEHVVSNARLTEAFLGLIILPVLGNTAEMATAVTVALKNKMDLAINVTIGSAIQITLFMAPAMVSLGWWMGKGLSMHFNMFQIITLLVTVAMVNAMMLSGRSHYLVGALLCCVYVVIA